MTDGGAFRSQPDGNVSYRIDVPTRPAARQCDPGRSQEPLSHRTRQKTLSVKAAVTCAEASRNAARLRGVRPCGQATIVVSLAEEAPRVERAPCARRASQLRWSPVQAWRLADGRGTLRNNTVVGATTHRQGLARSGIHEEAAQRYLEARFRPRGALAGSAPSGLARTRGVPS